MLKKILVGSLAGLAFAFVLSVGTVSAIPTLQLDIIGGSYVGGTDQTIYSGGTSFTLYAYLIPDDVNALSDTYTISAAIVPMTGPTGVSAGSFTFGDTTVSATGDMTYGIPPTEQFASLQGWDSGDLARHSIYETYFWDHEFSFLSANAAVPYDTAVNSGSGPTPSAAGTMYYQGFSVNTSGLEAGYSLHFDLYNTTLEALYSRALVGYDVDVNGDRYAAPFSHDAQSSPVPEPGTLFLLGSGLCGLALLRRRR